MMNSKTSSAIYIPTVCVMLSAYNGENYINEQIDSILSQQNVNVLLYIRDDGSTDKTWEIISHFAHTYKNVRILKGENVGWEKSFLKLVDSAPNADLYAFSDQDDAWLPDKLERAYQTIQNEKNSIVLYGSNVWVTDEKLNKKCTYCPEGVDVLNRPFIQRLDRCDMPGGLTYVFTPSVRRLLQRWPNNGAFGHDYICYMLCTLFGRVIYDPTPTVLYRQHQNNQIGAPKGFGWWLKCKLHRLCSPENPDRSIFSENVLKLYPNELASVPDTEHLLKKISLYPKDINCKLYLLVLPQLKRKNALDTLFLKLRILWNKW